MLNFLRKRLDTQSKTLFKNSSWVFIANAVGTGLTFIRGIVIARGLGAELFGIYTVVVAFINTVLEVLNLNLMTPIIKFGSQYKAENRPDKLVALIKSSMVATVGMAVVSILTVIILTYTSYSTFIKSPGLEWFAIAYSMVAGLLLFNHINRGVLRLFFKFKLNSIVQMIMDAAELLLVALALFIYPKELKFFLAAILISRFINFIIPAVAAYNELLPELKASFNARMSLIKEQSKEIWRFTINNSVARTVQSLINNGDVLLIGLLSESPAQAAYYAVGKKLAWAILTLFDPLTNSIYPQLCKLYEEKQFHGITKMLMRMSGLSALPALFFILFAWFFNEWVITLIFGTEYLQAGFTFFLLTIAAFQYAVFFWMQPLLQALNMTGIRLKVSLLGLATGIVAAYYLIPSYGASGMAVTMILMNVIMPVIFIYFVNLKLKSEKAALQP